MLFEVRAIEDALERMDGHEARYRISLVHPQWPCLAEAAHPSELALYLRLRAVMGFLDQDEGEVARWAWAAHDADPNLVWYADIGPEHPLRSTLEDLGEPDVVTLDDASVIVPKKGVVLRNGRPMTTPTAQVETPSFVQILDKKGTRVIDSYWQDGAAFRDELLGEAGVTVEQPSWWVPTSSIPLIADGTVLFGDPTAVAEAPVESPVATPAPVPAPPPKARGGGGGRRVVLLATAGVSTVAGGVLLGMGGARHVAMVQDPYLDPQYGDCPFGSPCYELARDEQVRYDNVVKNTMLAAGGLLAGVGLGLGTVELVLLPAPAAAVSWRF